MGHGGVNIDTVKVDNPVQAEFRDNLSWVCPAIEEILFANPQLTFTTEDVYAACINGSASLWVTDDGFVVTTSEIDPYNGDRTFLIWLAWAKIRGNNLVVKHQDFFMDYARERKYKKIEVRSAIPELTSYVLAHGWEIDTIVYTRDL